MCTSLLGRRSLEVCCRDLFKESPDLDPPLCQDASTNTLRFRCGRFVPADEPRSDLIRRMAWEIVGSPALLNSPFEAAQQCVRTDLIPAYEEELGSDASQPQLLHDAIATDFSFLAKVQLISERLSASGQCKSLFRYQFDGYRGRDAFHGSELTLLLGVPGDGVARS
eukprot:s2761_g10.t1